MMASSLKKYATPIAATEVDRIMQVAETISTNLPVLKFLDRPGEEIELYTFGDEDTSCGLAGLYKIDRDNRMACICAGLAEGKITTYARGALLWMVYHAFYELGMERVYAEVPHINEEFFQVELWTHLGFVIEGILRGHTRYRGKRCDVMYVGAMKADYLYVLEDTYMLTKHWRVMP